MHCDWLLGYGEPPVRKLIDPLDRIHARLISVRTKTTYGWEFTEKLCRKYAPEEAPRFRTEPSGTGQRLIFPRSSGRNNFRLVPSLRRSQKSRTRAVQCGDG